MGLLQSSSAWGAPTSSAAFDNQGNHLQARQANIFTKDYAERSADTNSTLTEKERERERHWLLSIFSSISFSEHVWRTLAWLLFHADAHGR